jgi:small-conductance mechanosensitive channel
VRHTLFEVSKVAIAVVVTIIAVQVTYQILRLIGRRIVMVRVLTRRTHRPFQVVVAILALDLALRASSLSGDWRRPVIHIVDLCFIGAAAWLLTALLFVIEDAALARFRTDVRNNRYARTVWTQVTLLRRVTAAAVTVVALAAILLTLHPLRLVGATIVASAGVAAAVAGFASQALLGNVIAGLQLAFGKSLRIDDVVVVENEWGRVEAITLTFVVVHIWDDRRLIFPTSYFTTKPFQNWTRYEASLLGQVEMEVDWTLPVEEMREELRVILADTDLWDRRIGVLQVTEALHGVVRLRALVSAVDAGTLWDLRCYTRERLIAWLRQNHPESLPRQRMEVSPARRRRPPAEAEVHGDEEGSRVFGGDAEGRQRGTVFHGPGGVTLLTEGTAVPARAGAPPAPMPESGQPPAAASQAVDPTRAGNARRPE